MERIRIKCRTRPEPFPLAHGDRAALTHLVQLDLAHEAAPSAGPSLLPIALVPCTPCSEASTAPSPTPGSDVLVDLALRLCDYDETALLSYISWALDSRASLAVLHPVCPA